MCVRPGVLGSTVKEVGKGCEKKISGISRSSICSTLRLQTLEIHQTTRHRSQDCLRAAGRGRPLLRPNPQGFFEFALLSLLLPFPLRLPLPSIASASRCFFAKSLHSLYEGHESRISRPGGWNSLVT